MMRRRLYCMARANLLHQSCPTQNHSLLLPHQPMITETLCQVYQRLPATTQSSVVSLLADVNESKPETPAWKTQTPVTYSSGRQLNGREKRGMQTLLVKL